MKANHVCCSCSACFICLLARSCAAHMGLELRAFSPFVQTSGLSFPAILRIDVPIFSCLLPHSFNLSTSSHDT